MRLAELAPRGWISTALATAATAVVLAATMPVDRLPAPSLDRAASGDLDAQLRSIASLECSLCTPTDDASREAVRDEVRHILVHRPAADDLPISAQEVERVAREHVDGTEPCGYLAHPWTHPPKVRVTLSIAASGAVDDVQLAQAPGRVEACLNNAIRSWRFRRTARSSAFQFTLSYKLVAGRQ